MTIESICRQDVDLVDADETAQVAAHRMHSRNAGSLLVLDAERRPIGIITDRDLATHVVGRGLNPADVYVREVMSPNPITTTLGSSVAKAISLMRSIGVRRLPVVDDDGTLAGVVTLDDILLEMAGEFEQLRSLLSHRSSQPDD